MAREPCRIVETASYGHDIVVYGALDTPVGGRIV